MTRTFTPTLRSSRPPNRYGDFSATDVDNLMTGISGVANAAARTFFFANQAARLAAAAGTIQVGDTGVDSDTGDTWLLAALPSSSGGNWNIVGIGSGMTNPMTALGDLIAGGVSGSPSRLAAGPNGDVLTIVSGQPVWATPPAGGMTNPMTTQWDLIVGGVAGAPGRLGIGSNGQVPTVVGGTLAYATPAAPGMSNPMTTLGDIIYENATPAPARLAGSTSATKKFLTQTGNGTISAAPVWGGIAAGDMPVAIASGASHAPGAVPDPGAVAGTSKFLREDMTFAAPPASGSPWFGGLALAPPVPGSFTWANQGPASATAQTGQTTMSSGIGTATPNLRTLYQAYSGNKRAMLGAIFVTPQNTASNPSDIMGIVVRDTTANASVIFGFNTLAGSGPGLEIRKYTSDTSVGSALFTPYGYQPLCQPMFLSIRDDGTNFYFELSMDAGQNWDTLYSVVRTTLVAPNSFGFAILEQAGKQIRMNAIHWSVL